MSPKNKKEPKAKLSLEELKALVEEGKFVISKPQIPTPTPPPPPEEEPGEEEAPEEAPSPELPESPEPPESPEKTPQTPVAGGPALKVPKKPKKPQPPQPPQEEGAGEKLGKKAVEQKAKQQAEQKASQAAAQAGKAAAKGAMAIGRGLLAFFMSPPGWITLAIIGVIVIVVFAFLIFSGGNATETALNEPQLLDVKTSVDDNIIYQDAASHVDNGKPGITDPLDKTFEVSEINEFRDLIVQKAGVPKDKVDSLFSADPTIEPSFNTQLKEINASLASSNKPTIHEALTLDDFYRALLTANGVTIVDPPSLENITQDSLVPTPLLSTKKIIALFQLLRNPNANSLTFTSVTNKTLFENCALGVDSCNLDRRLVMALDYLSTKHDLIEVDFKYDPSKATLEDEENSWLARSLPTPNNPDITGSSHYAKSTLLPGRFITKAADIKAIDKVNKKCQADGDPKDLIKVQCIYQTLGDTANPADEYYRRSLGLPEGMDVSSAKNPVGGEKLVQQISQAQIEDYTGLSRGSFAYAPASIALKLGSNGVEAELQLPSASTKFASLVEVFKQYGQIYGINKLWGIPTDRIHGNDFESLILSAGFAKLEVDNHLPKDSLTPLESLKLSDFQDLDKLWQNSVWPTLRNVGQGWLEDGISLPRHSLDGNTYEEVAQNIMLRQLEVALDLPNNSLSAENMDQTLTDVAAARVDAYMMSKRLPSDRRKKEAETAYAAYVDEVARGVAPADRTICPSHPLELKAGETEPTYSPEFFVPKSGESEPISASDFLNRCPNAKNSYNVQIKVLQEAEKDIRWEKGTSRAILSFAKRQLVLARSGKNENEKLVRQATAASLVTYLAILNIIARDDIDNSIANAENLEMQLGLERGTLEGAMLRLANDTIDLVKDENKSVDDLAKYNRKFLKEIGLQIVAGKIYRMLSETLPGAGYEASAALQGIKTEDELMQQYYETLLIKSTGALEEDGQKHYLLNESDLSVFGAENKALPTKTDKTALTLPGLPDGISATDLKPGTLSASLAKSDAFIKAYQKWKSDNKYISQKDYVDQKILEQKLLINPLLPTKGEIYDYLSAALDSSDPNATTDEKDQFTKRRADLIKNVGLQSLAQKLSYTFPVKKRIKNGTTQVYECDDDYQTTFAAREQELTLMGDGEATLHAGQEGAAKGKCRLTTVNTYNEVETQVGITVTPDDILTIIDGGPNRDPAEQKKAKLRVFLKISVRPFEQYFGLPLGTLDYILTGAKSPDAKFIDEAANYALTNYGIPKLATTFTILWIAGRENILAGALSAGLAVMEDWIFQEVPDAGQYVDRHFLTKIGQPLVDALTSKEAISPEQRKEIRRKFVEQLADSLTRSETVGLRPVVRNLLKKILPLGSTDEAMQKEYSSYLSESEKANLPQVDLPTFLQDWGLLGGKVDLDKTVDEIMIQIKEMIMLTLEEDEQKKADGFTKATVHIGFLVVAYKFGWDPGIWEDVWDIFSADPKDRAEVIGRKTVKLGCTLAAQKLDAWGAKQKLPQTEATLDDTGTFLKSLLCDAEGRANLKEKIAFFGINKLARAYGIPNADDVLKAIRGEESWGDAALEVAYGLAVTKGAQAATSFITQQIVMQSVTAGTAAIEKEINDIGLDATIAGLRTAGGISTIQSEVNNWTIIHYDNLVKNLGYPPGLDTLKKAMGLASGTLESSASLPGNTASQLLYQQSAKTVSGAVIDGITVTYNSIKNKEVDWFGVAKIGVCATIAFATQGTVPYSLCSLSFSAGQIVIPLAFQYLFPPQAGSTDCYRAEAIKNMTQVVQDLTLDMNPVYWGSDGKAYALGPWAPADELQGTPTLPLVISLQQVITSTNIDDIDNPYYGNPPAPDKTTDPAGYAEWANAPVYGHWRTLNNKIMDRVHFNVGFNALYWDDTRYLRAMSMRQTQK